MPPGTEPVMLGPQCRHVGTHASTNRCPGFPSVASYIQVKEGSFRAQRELHALRLELDSAPVRLWVGQGVEINLS